MGWYYCFTEVGVVFDVYVTCDGDVAYMDFDDDDDDDDDDVAFWWWCCCFFFFFLINFYFYFHQIYKH